MSQSYWLMKSEPDVFSIDDLQTKKNEVWDGVRNYQARNYMRDEMKVGDLVLFYHSNAKPPGAAGVARISKTKVVDPTQFDKKSEYYDEKSNTEDPRWICVEVQFKEKFDRLVPLAELREQKKLKDMLLLKRGQRLSIQPLKKIEFETVSKLGNTEA